MNPVAVSFDNYTVPGDVAVIAICVVMVILLKFSYVRRTRSLRIYMNIVGSIVGAALASICYHGLLARNNPHFFGLVYVLRILYEALLFDVFFLFALYTTEVSGMEHRRARSVAIISALLFVGIVGTDIILTIKGVGFHIAENGTVHHRTNLFMIGYVLFVILLLILMKRVQKLLYKRVMYGFYATMAVSVLVRFGQVPLRQSSLTTMTFVFPAIAMLYIMHSNPYDVTVGTLDIRAMEDMVHTLYSRKEPFIFMSLLLPEYNGEGKTLPEFVRAQTRRFSVEYFRNGVLFQIGNGQIVMLAKMAPNPDYEQWIQVILGAFDEQFQRYKTPFKIVYGESIEEISRKNAYASLIDTVHRSIPDNTIHRVCPEDIVSFNKSEYILSELTDIYNKHDVDDPRVLAFCQPVYNLQSGHFDTAEALMRLKLEKTGIVTPDQFISIAEDHGYIHVLTEIILNKTCHAIRKLSEEGFHINRISVNVSVLELKDEGFCGDIRQIIDDNRVSGEKLAIELTESHSEADFAIMKEKIEELRWQGFQFYLDDFGTGYSNMERIIELPFDIIKFDRSMVLASGTDERSEKIVENLAHMFDDMKYSVLYEGMEDDVDEKRCREMSASYLQGYKYSRPVPIEQLRNFLPKAG